MLTPTMGSGSAWCGGRAGEATERLESGGDCDNRGDCLAMSCKRAEFGAEVGDCSLWATMAAGTMPRKEGCILCTISCRQAVIMSVSSGPLARLLRHLAIDSIWRISAAVRCRGFRRRRRRAMHCATASPTSRLCADATSTLPGGVAKAKSPIGWARTSEEELED